MAVFLLCHEVAFAGRATCKGRFANPITDVCWSCIFPLKIGGVTLLSMGQEDNKTSGNFFCHCGNPPRVGTTVSFWEPVRMVDVVRDPFCLAGLGGVKMDPGINAPEAGFSKTDAQTRSSFYQAHWYVFPIMFVIQSILDSDCLDNMPFDVAYLTELDPLWNDDELTRIINPDVYLFGGLSALGACATDCVAATSGFSNNLFYWCSGCQGRMYPLNGHVQAHIGGVQASSLIMSRLIMKMHRERLMWAASGSDGMCGYYPQIIMDKTNYKYQMLYPIPQTSGTPGPVGVQNNSGIINCCQPLGRSTAVWGAGREYPMEGEDFVYEIFRKRDCCQGAIRF